MSNDQILPMYSGKESETATRLSKRRHDYLCFTAQHDFAPMSAVQQLSVFLQDCGRSELFIDSLCGIIVIVLIGNVIGGIKETLGLIGTGRMFVLHMFPKSSYPRTPHYQQLTGSPEPQLTKTDLKKRLAILSYNPIAKI